MSALLTSLPGDIPGLLRRGSPCCIDKWADYCAVAAPDNGAVRLAAARGARIDSFGVAIVYLDLTDLTGRVHAAWWVAERVEAHSAGARSALTGVEYRAWTDATQGRDMTALAIDTLARLVLRLAGRAA